LVGDEAKDKKDTCTGDSVKGAGTCVCAYGYAGTPTFAAGAWDASMCTDAKATCTGHAVAGVGSCVCDTANGYSGSPSFAADTWDSSTSCKVCSAQVGCAAHGTACSSTTGKTDKMACTTAADGYALDGGDVPVNKKDSCHGPKARGGNGWCQCEAGFTGTPTFSSGAWDMSSCVKDATPAAAPKPSKTSKSTSGKKIEVKTSNRLQGVTAASFTDAMKDSFKKAVEDTLTVAGTVKDITVTDVVTTRRHLRRLLATAVDVSYTIELPVADGETPETMFDVLTADLDAAIKTSDKLKLAIKAEMGATINLDADAYAAPASFVNNTGMEDDDLFMYLALIGGGAAGALIVMGYIGMKLGSKMGDSNSKKVFGSEAYLKAKNAEADGVVVSTTAAATSASSEAGKKKGNKV